MGLEKIKVEIGDWVKGESREGELIHGYIETINSLRDTVKVKVVASDNEVIIGRTIEIQNKVERLPVSPAKTEAELIGLIDLALSINDKEWFMELTETLNSIRNKSSEISLKKTSSSSNENKVIDQPEIG